MRTKFLGIDLLGPTLVDVILLAAAAGAVALSMWVSLISRNSLWLARSGSLMVLFAAIVEFRNVNLQQRLNDKATEAAGGMGGVHVPTGQPPIRRIVMVTAHIFVLVGTVIWGYGDLVPNDL